MLSCLLLPSVSIFATAAHAAEAEARRTNIGLEGLVVVTWDGPALEPKSEPKARTSPIHLRVVGPTGDGSRNQYRIHYVGTRAGRYHLRDFLQRRDGAELANFPPLEVQIDEVLPAGFVGDLATVPAPALPWTWPYRTLLIIAGVVWIALAGRFVVRRIAARPKQIGPTAHSAPSLADRLRPLVEIAMLGKLTPAEKAQLEQLLIGHWRDRLDGDGLTAAELLRRMRLDPVAGELLANLESWLHRPLRPESVDVSALLEPYRDIRTPPRNDRKALSPAMAGSEHP
jgi:hypothetical protein